MQLNHHLARMGPRDPFDRLADLSERLIIRMGDRRDAAEIARREARTLLQRAEGKDLEADAIRARINRLSLVRARLHRGAM